MKGSVSKETRLLCRYRWRSETKIGYKTESNFHRRQWSWRSERESFVRGNWKPCRVDSLLERNSLCRRANAWNASFIIILLWKSLSVVLVIPTVVSSYKFNFFLWKEDWWLFLNIYWHLLWKRHTSFTTK